MPSSIKLGVTDGRSDERTDVYALPVIHPTGEWNRSSFERGTERGSGRACSPFVPAGSERNWKVARADVGIAVVDVCWVFRASFQHPLQSSQLFAGFCDVWIFCGIQHTLWALALRRVECYSRMITYYCACRMRFADEFREFFRLNCGMI